jgi:hypothetical protein
MIELKQMSESDVKQAQVIETIADSNKTLEVCEVDGSQFIRMSVDELQDAGGLPMQSRSVYQNQLQTPSELRELGVIAPDTQEVGEFIVMDYIEGETADEVAVDDNELVDVLAAILASGNQDAHPSNVVVDDDGELWAVDFDWATQQDRPARMGFEQDQSQSLSDEMTQAVLDKAERLKYDVEQIRM